MGVGENKLISLNFKLPESIVKIGISGSFRFLCLLQVDLGIRDPGSSKNFNPYAFHKKTASRQPS